MPAGATLGSTLVFLLVRRWGIRVLELYFPEKIESLKFMQNTPKVRVIAFLLMFIPGTPKDLVSYCMGLTKIKLTQWILLSTVAWIPSIVTSTVGGDALGGRDYRFAVLVFAVTLAVSILGALCIPFTPSAIRARPVSGKRGREAYETAPGRAAGFPGGRLVSRRGPASGGASRLGQEAAYVQHGATRCLLHSVAVAYYCDCLARRLGPLGFRRLPLLRALCSTTTFSTTGTTRTPAHRLHGFRHPARALANARRDLALDPVEAEIILRHMFP